MKYDDQGRLLISYGAGVFGPGASTDNAIVRWDGATGTAIQDSLVIISDVGDVILPEYIYHTGDLNTYLRFEPDRFHIFVGGTDILDINATTIVFNTLGADVDFRIEGDTEINLFYVDAGNDRVGIGTATPTYELDVVGDIGLDEYLYHNIDPNTYIRFTDTPEAITIVAGGDDMIHIIEAALSTMVFNEGGVDVDFRWETLAGTHSLFIDGGNGKVFINDTANADMTIGLTINQAQNDDEILAFKSPTDVAHGITAIAETDTYCAMMKAEPIAGGLKIWGLKSSAGIPSHCFQLWGILGENVSTTKNTTGHGIIVLDAGIKLGASKTSVNADGNMVTIENNDSTRFIFDAEGELHSDDIIGIGDDWDEWDDLQLASDISRLPKAKFGEMVRYKGKDFEKAGLLTLSVDEEGQHAFIRHKAMLQFSMCCFADIHDRFMSVDEKLERYERALAKLGISQKELLALMN